MTSGSESAILGHGQARNKSESVLTELAHGEQVMLPDTRNRLLELIKPRFPKKADLRTSDDASPRSLCVRIDWCLKNDPGRPNKRSKLIDLRLSEEFVEDYEDGTSGIRTSMENRLVEFVTTMLRSFDPDHDAPRDVPPPQVVWIMTYP